MAQQNVGFPKLVGDFFGVIPFFGMAQISSV
jgi:hypothetical protein